MKEHTKLSAFRLPDDLLERVDAYVERLRLEQPGVRITRADAVRLLLGRALGEVEKRKGSQ